MNRNAAFLAAIVSLAALGGTARATSSETCIQLAFVHPHTPTADASSAHRLFNDVNVARAARGLTTLTTDERLNAFALEKAREMAARHYFGHTDPNGVTFEDRLHSSGIRFRFAAENIAFDQDEAHANAALLASPGHYANIVDPNPRRLGVAVVDAGEGEIFYVEEFAD